MAAGTRLSHESATSHALTVTATDPDELNTTLSLTVNVKDVSEPPVWGTAAPTLSDKFSTSVTVGWVSPDTTDKPPLSRLEITAAELDSEGNYKVPLVIKRTFIYDTSATSGKLTGLKPSTRYDVSVAAVNTEGSSRSASVRVITFTTQPPNDPPKGYDPATCAEDASDLSLSAPAGTQVELGPLHGGSSQEGECSGSLTGQASYFWDPDGDALSMSVAVASPPAAVWRGTIGGTQSPVIDTAGTKLQFVGLAARAATDLEAVVTANDGRGGTVSRQVAITVAGFSGSAVPSFATQVADQTYRLGAEITSLVLPVASGGDLGHGTSGNVFDYAYALSGLPSGLSFDAQTRTLSGTPKSWGRFAMTYTAQDADLEQGAADTASQTFTITVPPRVGDVRHLSNPGADGTYAIGDTIWMQMLLGPGTGGGVSVVGSPLPQLAVQVGAEERLVPYRGTTGAGSFIYGLSFRYTVQEGDADADGVSIDANALRVNGATVATSVGVALSPEHDALPFDELHKVDGVRPAVFSATVNEGSLTITFGEKLDGGSTPAGSAFTVKGIGADRSPTAVSVSGATVRLTLGAGAVHSHRVTVDYEKPSGDALRDAVGNEVATFTGQVQNDTPDQPEPEISDASVNGSMLTLTFDEELDTAAAPPTSVFTVSGTDQSTSVTAVGFKSGAATRLELTLSPAVEHGDAGITLSYRKGTNPLQDGEDNEVAAFTGHWVTNDTPHDDRPAASDIAKTVDEDTTLTFAATDFTGAFSDPDGHTLKSVKIVTLPDTAHGTLKAGDPLAALSDGDSVAAADLGTIRFEPVANWNGSASFTYKVTDSSDTESAVAATVTITVNAVDDTVSVEAGSATEGSAVTFKVKLSATVGSNVVLDWVTGADDTTGARQATADTDYTAVTDGNLTIAANATEGSFKVSTTADTATEGDETFKVTISVPTGTPLPAGLTMGTASAVGTIQDDDGVTVTVEGGSAIEGSAVTFKAKLSAAVGADVVLGWVTGADDTENASQATAGTDYTAVTNGSVTITAGQTEASFTVSTTADTDTEGDETFKATITGTTLPAGVTIVTAGAIGTISDDDRPTASDISKTVDEDTTLTFAATDFTDAFSDPDGHTLKSVKIVTLPDAAHGTLKAGDPPAAVSAGDSVAAADLATITFEPVANWNGSASFTYQVTDSSDTESDAAATVTITVNAVDDTVSVQAGSATEGSAVTFKVKLTATVGSNVVLDWVTGADDTTGARQATADADYTAVTDGSVTITANATEGSFSVSTTADTDTEGDETFKVTISVPTANPLPAGLTMGTATAVGTIEDDDGVTVSVEGGSATEGSAVTFKAKLSAAVGSDVVLGWTTGADDTEGARQATAGTDYTAVTDGSVTIAAGQTEGSFTVSTTADAATEGDETFKATITGTTLPAGVTIVTAGAIGTISDDDRPTASDIAKTVDEDTALTFAATDFTGAFSDPDGHTLKSVKIVTLPDAAHGVLKAGNPPAAVNAGDSVAAADLGTITFEPAANWNGSTSFTYQVTDSSDTESAAAATVTITVTGSAPPPTAPTAPTASNFSKSTAEDTALRFTATDFSGAFSDADGHTLKSVRIVTLPDAAPGTLKVGPAKAATGQRVPAADLGTISFEPAANWNGTASFTFKVIDSSGQESAAAATVTIRVTPVNDPPEANAGADLTVDPGVTVTLDGSGSSDVEDDPLTFAWTQTSGTEVTLQGAATATPSFVAPEVPGALTFRLTVADPGGLTASDTVTVTVRDIAPSFGGATVAALKIERGRPIEPVVLPAATGGNGALSYRLTSAPTGLAGLAFDPATRTLSGTPETVGDYVFTYRADDADDNRTEADAAVLRFAVTVLAATAERLQAMTRTLAAVGTRTLASALDNIGARFADAVPATTVTVAGRRLPLDAAPAPASGAPGGMRTACWAAQGCGDPFGDGMGQGRRLDLDELLHSSAFSWTLAADEAADPQPPRVSLWGTGDVADFAHRPDTGPGYEGQTWTAWLGGDVRSDAWLAGLALSHGVTEADYWFGDAPGERGRLATTLTTLLPYGRWTPAHGFDLRAILGIGAGKLRHAPEGGAPEASGLSTWLASIGARQELPPVAGIDLAVRADASFARMQAADAPGVGQGIDGLRADAWRARLGLTASRQFTIGAGSALAPFVEVVGRSDGGDGLNGTGLEVAGGVRYAAARLQVEARGRMLAAYTEAGVQERGLSLTARLTPAADGLGLALALTPRWGAGTGGAQALWRDEMPKLTGSADAKAASLDASIGYGFASPWGVITPFAEGGLTDGESRIRLGTRFRAAAAAAASPTSLAVELSGERRERAGSAPEQGLNFKGALSY